MSQKITGPGLESSDLCPASSAKLSARHSGEATQRNSKLCSARPSRCRNACKDLSSVKLTSGHSQLSLESPHGTSKHLYIYISYIIHPDPSSSSSPSLSDILICPPSSVIRHPSSVIHPRSIMHPSFIILHACSQIKNAKRHPSARLEHHAADETSNPPNAGH